jgi:hypothetical protein
MLRAMLPAEPVVLLEVLWFWPGLLGSRQYDLVLLRRQRRLWLQR